MLRRLFGIIHSFVVVVASSSKSHSHSRHTHYGYGFGNSTILMHCTHTQLQQLQLRIPATNQQVSKQAKYYFRNIILAIALSMQSCCFISSVFYFCSGSYGGFRLFDYCCSFLSASLFPSIVSHDICIHCIHSLTRTAYILYILALFLRHSVKYNRLYISWLSDVRLLFVMCYQMTTNLKFTVHSIHKQAFGKQHHGH